MWHTLVKGRSGRWICGIKVCFETQSGPLGKGFSKFHWQDSMRPLDNFCVEVKKRGFGCKCLDCLLPPAQVCRIPSGLRVKGVRPLRKGGECRGNRVDWTRRCLAENLCQKVRWKYTPHLRKKGNLCQKVRCRADLVALRKRDGLQAYAWRRPTLAASGGR